jgi:hypothetical protein
MPVGPEAALQIDVLKLSKEIIEAPFRLRAFDRSRDFSGRQHLNESERGIRTGTPDTELLCAAPACFGRSINIELKAGNNKPSREQETEMDLLRRAGAYCGVAWSCVEVVEHWRAAGVPLCPNADLIALDRDLKRQGRAMKRRAA